MLEPMCSESKANIEPIMYKIKVTDKQLIDIILSLDANAELLLDEEDPGPSKMDAMGLLYLRDLLKKIRQDNIKDADLTQSV